MIRAHDIFRGAGGSSAAGVEMAARIDMRPVTMSAFAENDIHGQNTNIFTRR